MIEPIYYQLFAQIVLYFILFYIAFKLLKGFYTCYLGYALGLGITWRRSPKSWAIITGATDGIGLEYANRLANIGYSLLILSRSEDKLFRVKTDILAKNPKCADIKILAVDFTEPDIYEKIERQIKELDEIEVLVNNVGMSLSMGEYFTKIPDLNHFIESIVNCNIISMTKMISLVLPKMIDRKHGVIINISSISALNPIPLLSIYSATKVYCDYLSRSLQCEYKSKGIIIQTVLPSFVATKMSGLRPSFFCPTAHDYVSQAFKTVGIEDRTYGHFAHKMFGFVQDWISRSVGSEYNSYLSFNYLKDIRSRYYRKYGLK